MAVVKQRSTGVVGRPLRRWGLILFGLVLVLGGSYVWYHFRGRQAAEQMTFTTVSVTPTAYDLTLSGPGTLEPSRSVSVSSSVAGTIETMPAVGDTVRKGQVLVQLETTTLEQAVSAAQLALEQARSQQASLDSSQNDVAASLASDIATAQRTVAEDERALKSGEDDLALAKRLQAVGSESGANVTAAQNTYDSALATLEGSNDALATLQASASLQSEGNIQDLRNAELGVQEAQLTLTSAQRDLKAATISAPIAGVVTSISDEGSSGESTSSATIIQGGTTLSQGQTILTLSNYSTINLIAQIDETQISQVSVGQPATVAVDALGDETFAGTVSAVSPSAEVQDNIPVFEVTVSIGNPNLALRPGMTAEANIAVETIPVTLSVPTAAVQARGEMTFVQLEQENDTVSVPVEVVGSEGLNSVVQVVELPVQDGAADTRSDAIRDAAPPVGANGDQVPSGPPDFSTLVQSGEVVKVRVPGSSAAPTTDEGDFGGPPGGGFGGPPGGGFR